ncbi:hypothetical protein CCMA1212_006009 [Trichoderma ghanense]|uniref:Uncharacterized protein n=1 Tax=Trichoderma ghanense TaxID=65468 RepID=A0ABY2H3F0_9HYPO
MRFNCMPDRALELHGPVARTVQLSVEVVGGRSGSMMVNFSGRMGGRPVLVAACESLTSSPSLICGRSRRRIMQSDEAPLRAGSGAEQRAARSGEQRDDGWMNGWMERKEQKASAEWQAGCWTESQGAVNIAASRHCIGLAHRDEAANHEAAWTPGCSIWHERGLRPLADSIAPPVWATESVGKPRTQGGSRAVVVGTTAVLEKQAATRRSLEDKAVIPGGMVFWRGREASRPPMAEFNVDDADEMQKHSCISSASQDGEDESRLPQFLLTIAKMASVVCQGSRFISCKAETRGTRGPPTRNMLAVQVPYLLRAGDWSIVSRVASRLLEQIIGFCYAVPLPDQRSWCAWTRPHLRDITASSEQQASGESAQVEEVIQPCLLLLVLLHLQKHACPSAKQNSVVSPTGKSSSSMERNYGA